MTVSKKKVAVITNIPAPYRVALFCYLSQTISEFEWHFIFAAENEDNRNWASSAEKLRNVYFLKSHTIKQVSQYDNKYIHLPGNIGEVLNRISPQAVIGWEYNPIAIISLFWCKTHNCKYINLTDGTLHSERNIGFAQKLSRKLIIGNSDAYIASSTKAKEKLIFWGAREDRIHISLLTVNIEPYIQLIRKPVKNRILYVGRCVEGKGLDLLFSALKRIEIDYSIHIVGDGPEESVLKEQAEKMGLSEKIVWSGFKEGEELLREYAEAALFVFPTRDDCFGLVLLEASAAGMPIVCSKYADGVYDIPGNISIVDPNDEVLFAESIQEKLNSSKFEDKKGEIIQAFSFESVSKGYISALKSVL